MILALILSLTLNACPPEDVWQVVAFYEYPPGALKDGHYYKTGEVLRHVEMKCGRDEAWARAAEIQRNGFGIEMSWYCNWVGPSMVRGFAVTPEIR